jgi:outer membrane cobalamin receptor
MTRASIASIFLFSFLFSILLTEPTLAATIAGRVADPDGRAVRNAQVIVGGALGIAAQAVTDDTGAFSVDVPAGDYEVRVAAAGFQANPIAVTVGANDVRDLRVPLRISALAESIVVSASQVEVPLSRAADSVTVITSADLEAHQVETVADALRLVPGLSVTRSGGRGAITSLFPRGGGSNYTLVLVDGIRANAFGGGYDFAHLSTADVDRVEIVRGPESALFGSDAIGAVIQIVTKRGGPPRGEALVEGGSEGTMRTTVAASAARGSWSFGGGAEHTRSDGFTGIAPADGERVTNDDYHLTHFSGTVGWQRANGPDLLVSGNIGRDERGFPGPFGSDPIGAFPGVDRLSRGVNHTRQIGARFTHPWSARVRQRVEANDTNLTGDFASAFGGSTSATHRADARIQEDFAFSHAFAASAGVEALRERGSSTFITGLANEPLPIVRSVVGTFGEVRYVSRERLFVTGGVRVEHIARDSLEANVGEFSARPAFPAQTVNSVNPKIAVSYVVSPPAAESSTRVRASAGTGIRPPDAFEIAFTDNPNLKPERSRSYDAGIEQLFAGGKYVATATAFFNSYDQLIVTVGRSLHDASRYRSDNISNARARGVELGANARLGPGFTVRATYTFLDSEILSVDGLAGQAPPPFHVGDALIRRPRHQAGVDLTYRARRLTAFAEATTRSRILDVEPNFGSFGGLFFSAGYTVINAGASVPIGRGLDLYARVLNLADRAYEETLGFPALRRSGIVGLRFVAGR